MNMGGVVLAAMAEVVVMVMLVDLVLVVVVGFSQLYRAAATWMTAS